MKNIDLKDKRILYELCKNSRQGFSRIASKVGLSKNAVAYRVERLKEKGIIRKFFPIINYGALRLDSYDLFFKLNVKPGEEKKVLDYLKSFRYTIWLIRLSGEWDLFLEVAIKDIWHFSSILTEILSNVGGYIDKYEVHANMGTIKSVPVIKEFFRELHYNTTQESRRPTNKQIIDDKDKQILVLLSKDGLMPQYQIADKIKLSADAVAYRMKNMEKKGVILRYIPEIMMKPLDYSEYFMILELRNPSSEDFQKLKDYIRSHNNVEYAFRGTTKFEILMFVSVKKPEDLDIILKDFKSKFFNIIVDQKIVLALDNQGLNLFPEGLLTKEDK